MAIGTDAAIEFFGTADQVDSTPGTVADGAFSVTGDVADWTNDDDAPQAGFELMMDFGASVTAGGSVDLYCQHLNFRGGTDDSQVPDADFPSYYLGAFTVDQNNAAAFRATLRTDLPNLETSQVYEFYIHNNNTGQTLSDWELWITPITVGPHA